MTTSAHYQVTTSIKEVLYLRQKALREKINPQTNKKYTVADIIQAGVESLDA